MPFQDIDSLQRHFEALMDYAAHLYAVAQAQNDETAAALIRELEVDFVCNKGSKRYYVQSAFAIPDEAKMRQESNSLLRIDDWTRITFHTVSSVQRSLSV